MVAEVDPETRHLLHTAVTPTRSYLTTRRFLEELAELYGRTPPIVVIDGVWYGPVFDQLEITHVVRRHSIRNHIECWIQELKRRIDMFYAPFTGYDVTATDNWLRNAPGSGMSA